MASSGVNIPTKLEKRSFFQDYYDFLSYIPHMWGKVAISLSLATKSASSSVSLVAESSGDVQQEAEVHQKEEEGMSCRARRTLEANTYSSSQYN